MAYVPGFDFDVFVSYAHASDQPALGRAKGWVTELKEELDRYLTGRTAPAPQVYIDHSDLRRAGAYPQDIAHELRRSALLLTVNCEPYLESDFCTWEVAQFREEFSEDPRTPNGARRIVEIYKSLLADGSVPRIQGDNNGFWFCGNPARREPDDTFELGSNEYANALKLLGKEVSKLLFSMRKELQCIFLSPPVDAADPNSTVGNLYQKLRAELRQEYQVVPFPGNTSSDADSLARSLLSVHFLSRRFDQLTIDRISMARQADHRVLVVIAHDLGSDEASPMSGFLNVLKSFIKNTADELPAPLRLFSWVPGKHQTGDLVALVQKLIPSGESPTPTGRGSLVYLICDPRDVREEEVQKLCDHVQKSPMNIALSRSAQDTQEGVLDHLKNLATCDGIVLLWGRAGEDWFRKYQSELKSVPGFRPGRAVDSKSMLLRPKDERKILIAQEMVRPEDLWEGFDPSKLDSFLASVRNRTKSRA
jgi:hypothetical protein